MRPRILAVSFAAACAAGDGDTHAGAETTGDGPGGSVSATAGASSPTTTRGGGDDGASGAGADSTTTVADAGGPSDTEAPAGPITCRIAGDDVSTITFVNGCDGVLSYRGSLIDGGELGPGEHACHDIGDAATPISAIRYWGFVGPDPGGERHTLAELTLNTDFNDFDWYNISHVDAHNLPMQIVPVDRGDCRPLSCPDSLLPDCPPEGRFSIDGTLVACVSPDRDDPDSPVAQYFEASCADAYSWSGDDADSVVACAAEDFDVVFCP